MNIIKFKNTPHKSDYLKNIWDAYFRGKWCYAVQLSTCFPIKSRESEGLTPEQYTWLESNLQLALANPGVAEDYGINLNCIPHINISDVHEYIDKNSTTDRNDVENLIMSNNIIDVCLTEDDIRNTMINIGHYMYNAYSISPHDKQDPSLLDMYAYYGGNKFNKTVSILKDMDEELNKSLNFNSSCGCSSSIMTTSSSSKGLVTNYTSNMYNIMVKYFSDIDFWNWWMKYNSDVVVTVLNYLKGIKNFKFIPQPSTTYNSCTNIVKSAISCPPPSPGSNWSRDVDNIIQAFEFIIKYGDKNKNKNFTAENLALFSNYFEHMMWVDADQDIINPDINLNDYYTKDETFNKDEIKTLLKYIGDINIWENTNTINGYVSLDINEKVIDENTIFSSMDKDIRIYKEKSLIWQIWNPNRINNSSLLSEENIDYQNKFVFYNKDNTEITGYSYIPQLDGTEYQYGVVDIPKDSYWVRLGIINCDKYTGVKDDDIKVMISRGNNRLEYRPSLEDFKDYVLENVVIPDVDDFVTKEYVDSVIEDLDLTGYYTKEEIDTSITTENITITDKIKVGALTIYNYEKEDDEGNPVAAGSLYTDRGNIYTTKGDIYSSDGSVYSNTGKVYAEGNIYSRSGDFEAYKGSFYKGEEDERVEVAYKDELELLSYTIPEDVISSTSGTHEDIISRFGSQEEFDKFLSILLDNQNIYISQGSEVISIFSREISYSDKSDQTSIKNITLTFINSNGSKIQLLFTYNSDDETYSYTVEYINYTGDLNLWEVVNTEQGYIGRTTGNILSSDRLCDRVMSTYIPVLHNKVRIQIWNPNLIDNSEYDNLVDNPWETKHVGYILFYDEDKAVVGLTYITTNLYDGTPYTMHGCNLWKDSKYMRIYLTVGSENPDNYTYDEDIKIMISWGSELYDYRPSLSDIGGNIDTSNYYTKEDVDTLIDSSIQTSVEETIIDSNVVTTTDDGNVSNIVLDGGSIEL